MGALMMRGVTWFLILFLVFFYPPLISKYVFLPLLIGFAGYIFIVGVDKEKMTYIVLATLYFINLEINLSLPLFLMIVASLATYLLFVRRMMPVGRCKICKPIYAAFMVDIVYFLLLLFYDFIFQTNSIVVDSILLYSLLFDVLAVTVL
jgi:hypothetical protein